MTATFQELATADGEPSAVPSIDRSCLTGLTAAVEKYFDLMYDCDTSRFDEVFRSTVQLHGVRDGQMVTWSARTYKDILDKRQSPKSLGAARLNEILLMDFASADMAFVKARVKIAAMVFVDYLTWHCIEGKWLITSKSFYVESNG
jgi:Putative lumazine-binding